MNKYPLLTIDKPNKKGLIYPREVIESAIKSYKKRLSKTEERISGEISARKGQSVIDLDIIPNEKGEVLYWDDLVIEDDILYGILSEETQELLEKEYPNEERKFVLRLATKAKRSDNGAIIAVGAVICAVDKFLKRPDKSVN